MKKRTTLKGKEHARKAMAKGMENRKLNESLGVTARTLDFEPSMTNHARHRSRQLYRQKVRELEGK